MGPRRLLGVVDTETVRLGVELHLREQQLDTPAQLEEVPCGVLSPPAVRTSAAAVVTNGKAQARPGVMPA